MECIGIIDDDAPLRRAVSRLLVAAGYRVELFASAEDFTRAVSSTKADCLLLDIDLGRSSGIELARALSVGGFDVPIVFMTGSADEHVLLEVRELGYPLLPKPFVEDALLGAVRRACTSDCRAAYGIHQ
jgi:FixJ family two-component response regulator